MGPEFHYEAVVEHEVLGILSWNLWEYPVGIQNYNGEEIGEHRLIQDFDYGLEHEEEFDLDGESFDREPDSTDNFAEMSEKEQIDAMVDWFNLMFEDPHNQMPYAGKDTDIPYAVGNYLYPWGGPYDAIEELEDRFSSVAEFETIEKAAEIVINQNGVHEWAPSDSHPDMLARRDEAWEDQFADVPTLEEIQSRLREHPSLTVGTEREVEARREVLALVDDLRPLLARASGAPMHGGIGHNQPPAQFQIPDRLATTINVNMNVIVTQATESEPDAEAVAESVGILQSTWNEIKDFVMTTKDQVKSLGSKALAGAIVTGLGALVWKCIIWLSALLGFPLL